MPRGECGTAIADTLAGGAGTQSIVGGTGNDAISADIASIVTSVAFEPHNVSGLQLWLDGADQSTLFSDAAGATQVTDGGNVARWNDKSGQGNHATQSTAGSRPTWDAYGQNGIGAANFDGDDLLDIAYDTNLNDSELSSYVIANVTGGVGNYRSPLTSRNAPTSGYIFYADNAGVWQAWIGNAGSWGIVSGESVTLGELELLSHHITSSGTLTFFQNGINKGSTGGYIANDSRPTRIGAGATEGAGSFYFLGYIPEVIIYSTALSTADRQLLELYQSAKWGIALATTGAVAATPGIFSDGYFVDRNAALNTEVADLREVLGSVTPTYSITSGNGLGIFAINAATGEITVANATALAADTSASYSLGISAALSSGGAALTLTTTIAVQNGNDTLEGGAGNDTLNGSAGNNLLDGGADNDTLYSKGGNDTLIGGTGQDTMTGGGGVDRFTFSATNHSPSGTPDTILSFNATADLLVFTGLLTGSFSFVGAHSNAFAGAGNSSARFNDTTDLLEIDTNGDATADMNMTLTSVALADLSAADFGWS